MNEVINILNTHLPEKNFILSSDYINDGLLDSFDIITLIVELENKFNIIIDPEDIIPENFINSIAISELIKKRGGYIII